MSKPKLSNLARELDRDLRTVRQIIKRPIEALIESGGLTGPQQSAMQVLVESDGLRSARVGCSFDLECQPLQQAGSLVDRECSGIHLLFPCVTVL